MAIIATGIDLAKNVFAVHSVNQGAGVELHQPRVARGKLNALLKPMATPSPFGFAAASQSRRSAKSPQVRTQSFIAQPPQLRRLALGAQRIRPRLRATYP